MGTLARALGVVVLHAVGVAPAVATQLNIDLHRGEPLPDNAGTPSNGYAAAAPQAGTWNGVSVLGEGTPQPLVDDDGSATSITILFDGTGGGRLQNNPSTSGDDEALLDDGFNINDGLEVVATLTIIGLPAGSYDVYTYAWDPSSTANRSTLVDVNGLGQLLVEPLGDFAGFEEGRTHVVHTVTIAKGEDIEIAAMNNDDVFDQSTINGLQVVPSPPDPTEPRSWGQIKSRFD